PHSVLSNIGHRPARGSSPGGVRRVHGQQPTDAYPCRSRVLTGTLWREMYASTSACVHIASGETFTLPRLASNPTTGVFALVGDSSRRRPAAQASYLARPRSSG